MHVRYKVRLKSSTPNFSEMRRNFGEERNTYSLIPMGFLMIKNFWAQEALGKYFASAMLCDLSLQKALQSIVFDKNYFALK